MWRRVPLVSTYTELRFGNAAVLLKLCSGGVVYRGKRRGKEQKGEEQRGEEQRGEEQRGEKGRGGQRSQFLVGYEVRFTRLLTGN
ncbi:hypothetical protein N658DRAFT_264758 [Parathielavia hyrcaniae]|uniref:Uncharacterized protein n=1 Tax=Parathielavia hyrcaniae TaxID=113614 RepID=A0AAN6PTR4_9PEZI|nr:hypothetical protein N658DRAFT_264758 [Parathielavia hyrcaniae]